MTASLNLIARMSMVPHIVYPTSEPVLGQYGFGPEQKFPFDFNVANWQRFELPKPPVAISDINFTVNAYANLGDNHLVNVYLSSPRPAEIGDFIQELWGRNDGYDFGDSSFTDPQTTTFTYPMDDFNAKITQGDPAHVLLLTTGPALAGSWVELELHYTYQVSPADPPGASYVAWSTFHNTLVAGPGELTGVPHVHRGKWLFDRRSGCLVIGNESYKDRLCISGANVSPAPGTATRPGSACLESLCVGELGGCPVRYTVDGSYAAE